MKPDYLDILNLTKKIPIWYDRYGTPRFCRPHHKLAMGRIKCQDCGVHFYVALNDEVYGGDAKKHWYYGDPPYHGGCTGETMTSISEWEKEFN